MPAWWRRAKVAKEAMASALPVRTDRRHAIASWRIVAGAWAHFAVPAYLVAVGAAVWLTAPAGASLESAITRVPSASLWFLAGYTGLALASTLATAGLEPWLRSRAARREARDPARAALASERRVARAIADGSHRLGPDVSRLLDQLRGPGWDHADSRFQTLSTDLAELVRTSSAAVETSPPAQRDEVLALAAASLEHLTTAFATLRTERGRLDSGDAATVARYIESRYAPADFASEGE